MVSGQNADINDTLYLRDVAIATIFFWLFVYGVHIGANW